MSTSKLQRYTGQQLRRWLPGRKRKQIDAAIATRHRARVAEITEGLEREIAAIELAEQFEVDKNGNVTVKGSGLNAPQNRTEAADH